MAGISSSEKLDYRPDLDGLRSLAVVPVVLYHLGTPGFPGGFVGVDVFFVLSGFLITRLLASDLERNRFSLLGFYDRRIRRIAPALFLVLLFCTAVSLLLLIPDDLVNFGNSLAATAFSVSNFYFARQTGYFAPNAELMPLLHTWSLAVEEQFYLLFPLMLWAAWRHAGKWFGAVIWSLLIASFAWSIRGVWAGNESTFYLLPPRAWELLAGSVLALRLVPDPGAHWQREAGAGSGVAAILAAVFLYSDETPFPGLAAALPCLGAALVIWAGLGNGRQSITARLLSAPIPVFIGLISYSVYLWHWPLIVFAKHLLQTELSWTVQLIVAALTLLFSTLSWHLVERPLRAGGWPWPSRQHRFIYTGGIVLIFLAAGLGMKAAKGLPQRLSPDVQLLASRVNDFSPYRRKCHARGHARGPFESSCVLGAEAPPKIVVFGDSHAAELAAALGEIAKEKGESVRQLSATGCPPVAGFTSKARPECAKFVERSIAGMAKSPPSTVVLAAHYFNLNSATEKKSIWHGPSGKPFWDGLEATARELRKAGHNVILLGGVPPHTRGVTVPAALARWSRLGNRPEDYRYPLDRELAASIEKNLSAIAKSTGAVFVTVTPYFCADGNNCAGYRDRTVLFFDDHHISVAAAKKLSTDLLVPLIWPTR